MEAINRRVIAFGFAKAFLKWFKTEKQRKKFLRGYNFHTSSKFLTKNYLQLSYLYFLIKNTAAKINTKMNYSKNLKKLDMLISGELN